MNARQYKFPFKEPLNPHAFILNQYVALHFKLMTGQVLSLTTMSSFNVHLLRNVKTKLIRFNKLTTYIIYHFFPVEGKHGVMCKIRNDRSEIV